MFYKMIENKCTQWYESDQCTVKNLIEYIKKQGRCETLRYRQLKYICFSKLLVRANH